MYTDLDRIKKLLRRQQIAGASKQEEIACFKKVIQIVLEKDIKEVNLDSLMRHLYKLENS